MVTATLAAVLVAGSPVPPVAPPVASVPDIARDLPPTWPPPGWPTRVRAAGEKADAQPVAAEKAGTVAEDKWIDAFPHVRINRAQKSVEFDGVVAWDFHDADAPRTELELLVCLPMRDKEHESLVLSKAKGAHVHAALLMTGLEPGEPGKVDFGDGNDRAVKRLPPKGPAVLVMFSYQKDGKEVVVPALEWVTDLSTPAREESQNLVNHGSQRPPAADRTPRQSLIFGGSRIGSMKNENGDKVNVYNADESGSLVGLCTFGSETIGLSEVISPDSGVDAPRFIANNAAIPPALTRVRVRVQPAKPATDAANTSTSAASRLPDRTDKKPDSTAK